MEIDPAGAIPTAFALAQAWEWDTDGDLESWTVNAGFNLDAATPTGGSIKGTAATGDPNMTSPVTTISTAYRVIVEFRIKKESSDASGSTSSGMMPPEASPHPAPARFPAPPSGRTTTSRSFASRFHTEKSTPNSTNSASIPSLTPQTSTKVRKSITFVFTPKASYLWSGTPTLSPRELKAEMAPGIRHPTVSGGMAQPIPSGLALKPTSLPSAAPQARSPSLRESPPVQLNSTSPATRSPATPLHCSTTPLYSGTLRKR